MILFLIVLIRSMTFRALSWLSQKSGAVSFSSCSASSDFSVGTSKIPPERAEAALERLGIEGLHVGDDGLAVVHGFQ